MRTPLVLALTLAASSAIAAPKGAPALAAPKGVRLMIGMRDIIRSALSPTGDLVALSTPTGLYLVELATGRSVATRTDLGCVEPDPNYTGPCDATMAFSPDGKRLAFWVPKTKKLAVVAVPTGRTQFTSTIDSGMSFGFAPDGRLFTLGSDGSFVFDTKGTRTEVLPERFAFQVSPDGTQALVDVDKPHIVNIETGRAVTEPPGNPELHDVVWAPDKSWIARTAGEWGDIVTWRASDRTLRTLVSSKSARETGDGERAYGFSLPAPYDRVFVSTDSGLVGLGLDGKRIFTSRWLQRLSLHSDHIVRHGDELIVIVKNCPVRLDTQGQPLLGRVLCTFRPGALAFDGTTLLSVPWIGDELMSFDTRTGALVAAAPITAPTNADTLAAMQRDPQLAARVTAALRLPNVHANAFQLSRDREHLFVQGSSDTDSAIIDLTTNKARTGLRAFIASDNGNRIAQYANDKSGRIDIRAVDDDQLVRSLSVSATLSRVQLSPDGSLLVVDAEKSVEVLDVASGRTVLAPRCKSTYAGTLVVSRNNRRLVCDTKTAVVVYDMTTKAVVRRIAHHNGSENADTVALSDDGRTLAIGAGEILIVDL